MSYRDTVTSISILSMGIVWNKHGGHSLQELTKQQLMDLQTAKKAAAEKSRSEKKKTVYLNVDDEGEVNLSDTYDKDSTALAYKAGSQIALPKAEWSDAVSKNVVKETKSSKSNKQNTAKQTVATETAETMKNKNSKKAAAKPAKKSAALAAVTGAKKNLAVKEIIKLLDKGVKVYRQSAPNANGLLQSKRMRKQKNQDKEIAVVIVKA